MCTSVVRMRSQPWDWCAGSPFCELAAQAALGLWAILCIKSRYTKRAWFLWLETCCKAEGQTGIFNFPLKISKQPSALFRSVLKIWIIVIKKKKNKKTFVVNTLYGAQITELQLALHKGLEYFRVLLSAGSWDHFLVDMKNYIFSNRV